MYYRVLTVECVWLSLCAFQWNQGFLWNVQDYEVLCHCTLYLYWYLDLLYLYLDFMYWYLYLLYLYLYLMT